MSMRQFKSPDEGLYQSFQTYVPWLEKEVTACRVVDTSLLLVELRSGKRVLYDDLNTTVEYIDDLNEEQWRQSFGRHLYRRMLLAGYGQTELARESGLSVTTINKYLNGKALPNFYHVKRLARVLHCDVNDLARFDQE